MGSISSPVSSYSADSGSIPASHHLQSSDQPGLLLVSVKLTGLSYTLEVEYVPEAADIEMNDEYKRIFEKFHFNENATTEENAISNVTIKKKVDSDCKEVELDTNSNGKGMSNRKKKLQRRMKIAELKQICTRPDLVEVYDVTAPDPKLLVFLKSYRNTVPVPQHWCQKRKFLQGKRGTKKPPFQLPDFIAATGIEKIRQENSKELKHKQHGRMRPEMDKMDIDYQVLHDAFFKHQTKPKLTTFGDLYYEGKESEVKRRKMKPGMLSQELMEALGIANGAPPPWLINMQRYGPPPSYPHLKIPGLNAPIPPGAKFGYGHGEWGKAPVDELGRPLYGDVFGVLQQDLPNCKEHLVDWAKHWGDLEEEKVKLEDSIQSVDSLSSIPIGGETPYVIDLHKWQRKEPEVSTHMYKEEEKLPTQRKNIRDMVPEEHLVDWTKHWGDLEEEKVKLEDSIQSVDSLSSIPIGGETPYVIDLHKWQRKEPEVSTHMYKEEEKLPTQRKYRDMVPEEHLVDWTKHWCDLEEEKVKLEDNIQSVDSLSSIPIGGETHGIDLHKWQRKEPEVSTHMYKEEEKLPTQRKNKDMVPENEKKKQRKMQEKNNKSKKQSFKF